MEINGAESGVDQSAFLTNRTSLSGNECVDCSEVNMADVGAAVAANLSAAVVNGSLGLSMMGHQASWLKQFRILTYTLFPEEMYFETLESTPSFILQPVPMVMVLMVLEALLMWLMGQKDEVRMNNYVTNFTSTAIQDSFTQFIFRGAELFAYVWIYDRFRVVTLPWDSFYTYLFALIIVDYFAYWWHRGSHEIALFWAAHEFHHNSEDFNLSVAMRLSFTMRFFKWLFYLPTAIMGLPVSTMWAHAQVGLAFNGFSHLSMVPPLGKVVPVVGDIIEFIFVTPTHHKVHHAMNEYAIDKNYGNVLILWDRIHGTFVEERVDEELSFGSLTPITTTSVIQLQNQPFVNLWNKMQSMDNLGDKLRALFYGPGWFPGTPRLGLHEDLPDMRGRPKWAMEQPYWIKLYLLVNCLAVFLVYLDGANRAQDLTNGNKLLSFLTIYYGYWALGGIYDYQRSAVLLELIRIVSFLGLQLLAPTPLIKSVKAANIAVNINVAALLMLPLVARHVFNRYSRGPSDQQLYMERLQRLDYVKRTKYD